MHFPELFDFSELERQMIQKALEELQEVGYDVASIQELIRVDFPPGYRGMTLENGAGLGREAFLSQDWLNHVLEEELLHLIQKAQGIADEFRSGTALGLENEVDDKRKFPAPTS